MKGERETLRDALAWGEANLEGEGARAEAEILLCHLLGRARSFLYSRPELPLSPEDGERFRELVEARRMGWPVAYLVGVREFWSLPLMVTPDVLIPRHETELLVELALARLPEHGAWRVLDLGTGSGAIALAIAHERRQSRVLATDFSASALTVARMNAAALGLDNVSFKLGEWFEAVQAERFDLIASNPPYVSEDDVHFARGDCRYEPEHALVSRPDGTTALRQIVGEAPAHLVKHGWLLVEHGHEQGALVRELFESRGYGEVFTANDLAGHERVTGGQW